MIRSSYFLIGLMNKTQILKTELLKFLLAVITSLLISQVAFQSYFRKGSLDIHFHDTYLVIDTFSFGLLLFMPVYYLVQLLHLSCTRRIFWPGLIIFLSTVLLLLFVLYRFHLLFLLFTHLYDYGGIWWGSHTSDVTANFNLREMFWPILFLLLSSLWIRIKFYVQKRKHKRVLLVY